jgi:hypothetical protein
MASTTSVGRLSSTVGQPAAAKRSRDTLRAQRAYQYSLEDDDNEGALRGTNGAVTLSDYRAMKRTFEENHAWNRTADALIERDPRTGGITLLGVEHAKRALSAEWSFVIGDGPDDAIPFFPRWLTDPERRTVRAIVNQDRKKADEFYVPFKFAYEQFVEELVGDTSNVDQDELMEKFTAMELDFEPVQLEAEDDNEENSQRSSTDNELRGTIRPTADKSDRVMTLFMKLIEMAAGDANTDTHEYLLDYIAHMIQCPLINPGIAIVLTGGKGVGKDTLCNFISNYIIGRSFSYSYMSSHQFFEKHDTNHMGKIMVKLEEADPAVLKSSSNAAVLRAKVTSEMSMANPKGMQAYQQPNYTRYFFTSNAVDPTGLNVDGRERRFLLLPFKDDLADRCPPGACGKLDPNVPCAYRDFWIPFHKEVMNSLGGFVVATALMKRDISKRTIFKLPYNPFLSVIAAHDMSPEELFVEDWRKDAIEELQNGGNAEEVDSKTLYDRFKSWMALNQPETYLLTSHQFYQKIAKQVRDKKVKMSVRGGRKAFYSIQ